MNIIKGLDRIALVIAVIAMLLGFVTGYNYTRREFKTVNLKYIEEKTEWEKAGEPRTKISFMGKEGWLDGFSTSTPHFFFPSKRKCILGGLFFASLFFLVSLFGICGLTRGIKYFSLWIIDGFKDKK